ncbi:MAG TPA: MFS transporter [Polyangiaceae bacterium]
MTGVSEPVPGRAAALRHVDFRRYQTARFASLIGTQMQSVAVGWQIYTLTGRPLDLGLVGLAQFLPAIALWPVTGLVADRLERRAVLATCHALLGICAVLLFLLARMPDPSLAGIYSVLTVVGAARAFGGPAGHSLSPNLVPRAELPNAIAWGSMIFHLSFALGPALGGLVYDASSAETVFVLHAALEVASVALLLSLGKRSRGDATQEGAMAEVVAGLRYVFQRKILLGAISLDLFAVLLGGAMALLPIFARDILHAGPTGLGLLRSAPALGAAATALWLAARPLVRRTGVVMFASVFVFGLATIVFALSRSLELSMLALAVAGASDMVSVYVRHSLVQLETPDAMRGRVAAVNLVFIGASNELGEFESGVTAAWLGTVRAAVLGGVGTCVVVVLWALGFPELRRVDRLDPSTRDRE